MSSSNVENPENVDSGSENTETTDDYVGNLHVVSDINTNSKSNPKIPRIHIFTFSIIRKMVFLLRESCFIMLLVFTYATFQNNTPKVSKSPNAFPFFTPGNGVKDWYRGQLSEAISLASESDLAFVMYYAPWDAESQAVRQEFNIVSQHLNKYVHFAAINCWQPGSECQIQYSKVYSWPVLMAYPTHGRGIQYKGIRKAEHMIKFLRNVMNPMIRIIDTSEKLQYKALYDAVIVSYIDAKPGNNEYGVLYTTALRFLERDPLREVPFLVLTRVHSQTNNQTPELHLELWNETLIYPDDHEWNPHILINWIFDNLHQVSIWASPQGSKTNYLSVYMQPGPALILFTPRNPLLDYVSYYSVLQEVAVEYYDCQNSILFKLLIAQQRRLGTAEKQYTDLLKKCSIETKSKKTNLVHSITYGVPRILLNNTCSLTDDLSVCPNIYKDNSIKCDTISRINHSKNFYEIQKNIEAKKSRLEDKSWTSTFIGKDDHLSPKNLQKIHERDKCHFIKLAHDLQPALFLKTDQDSLDEEISGLACKTNLSLSLLAMDSLEHHYFAERLGIDIKNMKDKTAAVILNPKFETHHIMKEEFTIQNLRNFIKKFTNGSLERLVTATLKIPTYEQKNSKINASFPAWKMNIPELTSETFLPTVLQQNKVVLIMYHSAKCSFCSGISYVLMSVARLLSPVNRLYFARIDGDINSLPWEYTMHHYPTILFFPAQRKSESRAFPHNVPITVPNLLSFILANVEPEMRLHIIWTLCRKTKLESEVQNCGRTLRLESTRLISKLLREYRSTNNTLRSAAVFKRLQHIRLLQFIFTTPIKLHTATVQQHMTMLYFNSQENNIIYEKL